MRTRNRQRHPIKFAHHNHNKRRYPFTAACSSADTPQTLFLRDSKCTVIHDSLTNLVISSLQSCFRSTLRSWGLWPFLGCNPSVLLYIVCPTHFYFIVDSKHLKFPSSNYFMVLLVQKGDLVLTLSASEKCLNTLFSLLSFAGPELM